MTAEETEALGRVLRSMQEKARVRADAAEARVTRLEERLNAALDRVDELEKMAEASGEVLRHIDRSGRIKLIKAAQ